MPFSDPPSWVQEAVFYQIFPDRFARSGRVPKPAHLEEWESAPTTFGYKGGDLLGVVEKLDYLQDLGVTALYFTPVFQSASNHRYHTHDYYRVDPMLGGDEALRELIEAVHERGMRIVLDGVFNHASRGFFQFSDILENGPSSAYLDWFHVHHFPLNAYGDGEIGYGAWWNLPALPKFNTDTPAVREFLFGVAEYWLQFGIDGWRLDVPNEIDDDAFWQEFRRRCRELNPECYIVGEIWTPADRWLQGDQFDAVMNYPITRAIFGLVGRKIDQTQSAKSGYGHIKRLDGRGFAQEVHSVVGRYRYETALAQLNLIGSHDTPRALTMVRDDRAAVRMAMALLLTLPGAPCIYYGDELGLAGGHDPYCRGTIDWDDRAQWDDELRRYVQALIGIRKRNEALQRGSFTILHASEEVVLFGRSDGDNRVIVAVNTAQRQRPLDLKASAYLAPIPATGPGHAFDGEYRDAIGGLTLTVKGSVVTGLDLPARRVVVYEAG